MVNKREPMTTALDGDIFAFCTGAFKRIPRLFWYVLISTAVFGLAAHLFAYTNLSLIHDSVLQVIADDIALDITTGRLGDTVIRFLRGFVSASWLIGMISIVSFALAAYIVCLTLDIKRPAVAVTVSALMVTFPAVALFNCYMFSADIFAIHVLLSCLSVYLANRGKYGFVYGTIVLFISLTIYQASLCVAASLSLIVLILALLRNGTGPKQVFFQALKCLVMLLVATAAYYAFWMLSLRLFDLELLEYSGMNQVGRFYSLGHVLRLIATVYKNVAHFFLVPWKYYSIFPIYAAAALLAGLAVTLFRMIRMLRLLEDKRTMVLRILLLVGFVLILPIAMDTMFILSNGSGTHFMQRYSFIMPWLFMLAAGEMYAGYAPDKRRVLSFAASCVVALSCVFSVYNGVYGANATYLNMQLMYDSALSTVTRIVDRIEGTEGFTYATPVIVVGVARGRGSLDDFHWCDDALAAGNDSALTYGDNMCAFIKNVCPELNVINGAAFASRDDVAAMPMFPQAGCTMWVNNGLLIKLS